MPIQQTRMSSEAIPVVGHDSGSGQNGFLRKPSPSNYTLDRLTGALYREEDRKNKATGQILPFPLETLEPQSASAVAFICEMESTLLSAYRSGLLNTNQKSLIRANIKKIRAIKKQMRDIMMDIERLRF